MTLCHLTLTLTSLKPECIYFCGVPTKGTSAELAWWLVLRPFVPFEPVEQGSNPSRGCLSSTSGQSPFQLWSTRLEVPDAKP